MPLAALYAGAFLGSLALSLFLTPAALRFAQRRHVFDHPGLYKTQSAPVPYLGGVAIVVSFSVVVMAAALLYPPAGNLTQLAIILGAGVGLAFIGLVDDLRGLHPILRLILQVMAAAAVCTVGVTVSVVPWPAGNVLIALVWIVGVTNAFNFLDNMDGLSAGVAAVAAAFIWLMAALNGQYLVASIAIALVGCTAGFLRHNFHPARIYMGDAGSVFVGFLLSIITIKLAFDRPSEAIHLVPVLVLGVAIFDMCLVTITRLLHHRSPLRGGLDHTSHRLVFVGIPVRGAVSLIYGAGASLGWLAVAVARVDEMTGVILTGLAISIAALLGVLLAAIPVYENSRRRHLMIREVVLREQDAAEPVGSSHASRTG